MDAGPFREQALMSGRVAQSIGENVSNIFGEIGQQFQENRNARTVLAADLTMRKTTDDFRDSLAKNPDEKTWIPSYQEQVAQVREKVLSGPDVNPAVKRQLSAMLDRWDQSTTAEIRTAAQLQSATRTKHTAIADYTYAARQGDEQGALAALDLAEKSHAMFPEDVARMRRELPGIVQQAQVETGLQSSPGMVLQKLRETDKEGKFVNFANIPPITRERLIVQANARHNAEQSANVQQIVESFAENPTSPPTEQELEQRVKSGEITAKAKQSILNLVEQKGLKEARDKAAVLAMQVHDHDFTVDKNPEQSAREFHDEIAGLPVRLQKPIMEQLTNRLTAAKKAAASDIRPVESEALSRLKSDPLVKANGVIKDLTAKVGNTYLTPDSEVKRRFGNKSREQVVQEAQIEQAKMHAQLREWFNQHKQDNNGTGPTDDEAELARQAIVAGPAVRSALQKAVGSATPSAEGLKQIQNNLSNGRPWYEGSDQPIAVVNPNGVHGTIPASALKKALASGYKLAE